MSRDDVGVEGPMTMPQEVMLAKSVTRLPATTALPGGCVYEPKWDGYRVVLLVGTSGCVMQSRRGADITVAFPEIARAATSQLRAGTVVDGGLVVWGGGVLDFTADWSLAEIEDVRSKERGSRRTRTAGVSTLGGRCRRDLAPVCVSTMLTSAR